MSRSPMNFKWRQQQQNSTQTWCRRSGGGSHRVRISHPPAAKFGSYLISISMPRHSALIHSLFIHLFKRALNSCVVLHLVPNGLTWEVWNHQSFSKSEWEREIKEKTNKIINFHIWSNDLRSWVDAQKALTLSLQWVNEWRNNNKKSFGN